MDARAAKLALARQKLKSHQEKKQVLAHKEEPLEVKNDNIICVDQFPIKNDNLASAAPVIEECNEQLKIKHDTNSHNIASKHNSDVNVSEILISTKQKLELQVHELQSKLLQLENSYTLVTNNNSYCKQQIVNLENELKKLQESYAKSTQEIMHKDSIIHDLKNTNSSLYDENNNLQEQLEFTKTILTTKESENVALQNQLLDIQSQLDATQLQLQQMTNGAHSLFTQHGKSVDPDQNPEILMQKISSLKQEIKSVKKEKDQISVHYEHYVNELNEQLKTTVKQNSDLESELQNLSARETALIEQISEMEIRIQSLRQKAVENIYSPVSESKTDNEVLNLQKRCEDLQEQVKFLNDKCADLEKKYTESLMQVQELQQTKETNNEHENLSLSKLTADIASDKLAAQRATEQNKKLKTDLQELEDAFVKISRDKLDLTEKVAAEKFLNRELTIKLAEIEEKAKDMHKKLLAKDEEMIRLLNSYRDMEKKVSDNICNTVNGKSEYTSDYEEHCTHHHEHSHSLEEKSCKNECSESEPTEYQHVLEKPDTGNSPKLPNQDAMLKLQDRFLKIMDEVANLSDEKHRLEHIILQLQTETDTICEYVALYQQQRSLLKKRDEERSAQIKLFQEECHQLKRQLEELSGIIIKLAQDTELAAFFQTEPRQSDLIRVMNLLSNLRSNTLIDPCRSSSELKNFYPCSCCSGQLIEV